MEILGALAMSLVPHNTAPELHCVEQLLDAGKFQAAFQDVESIKQQKALTPVEQLTDQLLKSRNMFQFSEYGLQRVVGK